jgi:hypothetical protein
MTKIDDMIAQGLQSMSRKYRRVFLPPIGKSFVERIKEEDPALHAYMLEDLEARAKEMYRSKFAEKNGDVFVMSPADFREYLTKTGRSAWKPTHSACIECQTLGNTHSKYCSLRFTEQELIDNE